MYLLYIDESGNENNPADKYFVLAGIAIYERAAYFLSSDLEAVHNKHFPGSQPRPFHMTDIRAAKKLWRSVERSTRQTIIQDIASAIVGEREPGRGVVLFAAAIEKSDEIYGEEAVKLATEQICRRFDIFLMRRFNEFDDPQRGLLIFSEGRIHKRAKIWVKGFRELGTEWGVLRNLVDIPYFANARETRLLQAADFIAHATFLLYERRDSSLIRPILHMFDQKDNIVHGLFHHLSDPALRYSCECPSCYSKRIPGNFGTWV